MLISAIAFAVVVSVNLCAGGHPVLRFDISIGQIYIIPNTDKRMLRKQRNVCHSTIDLMIYLFKSHKT